ncbi:MAG: heme lyase CcmF/NrfE family subunit, partial [Caldilineaceae bacterium]|nr:heme lyase CcmF/NrfE family subunit [Caldilineaceae bacterium]
FVTQNIYPIIGLAVCVFAVATIVQEYVRGVAARRSINEESVGTAMLNLMRRNGRRYGGYMVHLGIVFIGVAIIGNEFYQLTTNVTLSPGESVAIGGYEILYDGMESSRQANLTEFGANLLVVDADSGRQLGVVFPRRNIYDKTPDMPTSEVGLRMSLLEDVYVLLNGWEPAGASVTLTIYINPLTVWMWIGGLVLVFGVLIAIWPHPARRPSPQTTAASTTIAARA